MVIQRKLVAAAEVTIVVLFAAFLFRLLSATPLHQWELRIPGGQKFYIVEYAAILVYVCCLLALTHRSYKTYGISFEHPKFLITVVAIALIPFLVLGATLSFVNWRQWPGAITVSLVLLAILVITAWLLRKQPTPGEVLTIGALFILAPNALISLATPIGPVILKTLYFYLLVGPAEEILFRGYVQSRINEVWGQPYRFFGVSWGWGMIFGAILFGLWHFFLMPAVPGIWRQVLWTSFAGLTLGFLREKSASIVPSSILHSMMNYIPLT
jgi:membrane protease YdiL (CAAX protease family)